VQVTAQNEITEYDYIVVGSGAGGAPLAARLAQRGYQVLVLEAGSHAYPQESQIPLLHPESTEDPEISWQFMVRHFRDDQQAKKDPKADAQGRVFYPRVGALGGCTIHNAMITICGGNDEWNRIAQLTGDDSWTGSRMRSYFSRLERCSYLKKPAAPSKNTSLHGFDGWLTTSLASLSIVASDWQLKKVILAALHALVTDKIEDPTQLAGDLLAGRIKSHFDPNDWRRLKNAADGFVLVPLATKEGKRNGPRDFLLGVEETCRKEAPEHGSVTIKTGALVTRVLFDEESLPESIPLKRPKAVGVEARLGYHLFRADPKFDPNALYQTVRFTCKREVILSGGSFNTPQVLMLSGVGDANSLNQLEIACLADLPGVGQNLQDRYEVAIIHQLRENFKLLEPLTLNLENPDPELRKWFKEKQGAYTTNGAVFGVFLRSNPNLSQPDLFVFALPGTFQGYQIGYSKVTLKNKNVLTWAILKSGTKNRGGIVQLKSIDPSEVPFINFCYFEEGSDPQDVDLEALIHGVKYVERIEGFREYPLEKRLDPDPREVMNDDTLREWIRSRAWGHHACGTCRVGRVDDPLAVVDSRFRVRGVDGLRIVDASIFPEIPGFFIVTNTYMISEKAADVITEDAKDPIPPNYVGGATETLDVQERYWRRYTGFYPKQLREAEAKLIAARRVYIRNPNSTVSHSEEALDPIQNDYVGFAISGGGIRSATFHLGFIQTLARFRLLTQFDFMSTVSGGGYVGAFVGRLFSRANQKARNVPEGVCQRLEDSQSEEVTWLRNGANYIAPNGTADAATGIGFYLRSFLTVHFILLLTLFTILGLLNSVTESVQPLAGMISDDYSPLGPPFFQTLKHLLGDNLSPIFWPAEFAFWAGVIGLMLAYWLASQTRRESFERTSLQLSFLAMVVLIVIALHPFGSLSSEFFWALIALFSGFLWVELFWQQVRVDQGPPTLATDPVALQATRNLLTRALGKALLVFGGLAALAIVDSIGRALWIYSTSGNASPSATLLSLSGISVALLPVLRMIASLLSKPISTDGWIGFLLASVKKNLIPTLIVLLISLVPLSLTSFLVQFAYQGGQNPVRGFIATGIAILAMILLASARRLINLSSLQTAYAARLGRTFLGASNPNRRDCDGRNRVTEVIRGDDQPWSEYKPHLFGGPCHIVNVSVNQTYNVSAEEEVRHRKSENMAIGPAGVSVATNYHALWKTEEKKGTSSIYLRPTDSLAPVANPFRTTDEVRAPEPLTLQDWVAISGAAISPGAGIDTGLNHSLVFTLANLRTGYWWDSGAKRSQRLYLPAISFLRRWLFKIPAFLSTQTSLINEAFGNFGGPWFQTWYLSDGGFFEVTGAYELLRRRVRYIVIGDADEDPLGRFNDLSNLIMKARIDFNADIQFVPEETELKANDRLKKLLENNEILDRALGGLNDLRTREDGSTLKHATVGFVYYDGNDLPGSVILYFKASRTGDEDPDIIHYAKENPTFPNESTGNQFFNEPQWESYRRLGEHIGTLLFDKSEDLWIRKLLPD
jgi:choline dehydrogenase-like flavoprotein